MDQVEINKQAKLSEHFKLGELTKTKHVTADKNIPSHEVIENLKCLCWWLEELRYSYNTLYCLQPGEDYETSENVEGIVINSGYRSPAVNKLAGGVPTSNHVTATPLSCWILRMVLGKSSMSCYWSSMETSAGCISPCARPRSRIGAGLRSCAPEVSTKLRRINKMRNT